LDKREEISDKIQDFIDKYVFDWGVEIEDVAFKDISLSDELKNQLNLPAKERRLAESKIIAAKADV
jgi:erythrocyte band 7 integral membrane protein